MPYQPVVDVAQVLLMGRVDGQLTINNLYFQISGGGVTPVALNSLLTTVRTWWTTGVVSLLSDDFSAERVVGVDLTTQTGPRVELAAPAPGGVSGEANPNNVAACVSIRTDLRGRSARGRNFIPGIPGSLVTLNTLDPTFISDLLTQYNLLVGPGTFQPGWELVVVSRWDTGVLRTAGLAIPATSVVMVTNSVRSMRSREVGHGA